MHVLRRRRIVARSGIDIRCVPVHEPWEIIARHSREVRFVILGRVALMLTWACGPSQHIRASLAIGPAEDSVSSSVETQSRHSRREDDGCILGVGSAARHIVLDVVSGWRRGGCFTIYFTTTPMQRFSSHTSTLFHRSLPLHLAPGSDTSL